MSPGVRIETVRLKNRLPAIRRGRHFPQAGNRAFSQVVRLFSVAVYRPLSRKAGTSENCGFVLCTKCGPCRTARKQFSKGLRSKTGVQQHQKNAQKRLFRQTERCPAGRRFFRQDFTVPLPYPLAPERKMQYNGFSCPSTGLFKDGAPCTAI